MRGRSEACALAALALWVAAFWSGPLINDVGWQLWVGRQINAGAQLYVDILEVNPPLWFWLGALVQRAAGAFGLPPLGVLTLAFACCAAVAAVLCRALVPAERERRWLYAGLFLGLFLTSPYAHGQREQFTFIVTVPYVALIARRVRGERVRPLLAVAVALFAAAGFALKPHFALVPLALEAWLVAETRRVRLRPELIALAAAAVAYAAAVALVTPAYFTTIVPLLRLAYFDYGALFWEALKQPALAAVALALIGAAMGWSRLSALARAAAVTTFAFAAAYLLQSKGFHYQAVPALGAAILTVLVGFGTLHWAGLRREGAAASALAVAVALLTPIVAGPARFDDAAARATAGLPPGSPILVLSASGVTAWPLVEERGLSWPSLHMTMWMLPLAWGARRQGRSTPELERLGETIRREAAEDIACARPAVILVDSRYDELAPGGNVLGYFVREPRFAAALQVYAEGPRVDYLRVFRRFERRGADVAVGRRGRLRSTEACCLNRLDCRHGRGAWRAGAAADLTPSARRVSLSRAGSQ